jgi:hypothetical protein
VQRQAVGLFVVADEEMSLCREGQVPVERRHRRPLTFVARQLECREGLVGAPEGRERQTFVPAGPWDE